MITLIFTEDPMRRGTRAVCGDIGGEQLAAEVDGVLTLLFLRISLLHPVSLPPPGYITPIASAFKSR